VRLINPLDFKATRPWGALDIAKIDGATVRLHWSDQPYRWHVNDGAEVFVVISGEVEMHYKEDDEEKSLRLKSGDIFLAEEGDAHFAEPIGEARVLVVEREGSV
jgi:mannose-6-phosphate isomerase-like protein (cupin superfamily)